MTKQRKIRVGLDFDGVVAYNPFRLIRSPISYVKRNILGVRKLKFWYPKARWQQLFWIIIHESSVFPSSGVNLLRTLSESGSYEFHLITARYSFLDHHLDRWLKRYRLKHLFTSITINSKDEQPHMYKERIVAQKKLDYFIEDNLDIVLHLHGKSKTKIFWIYNLFDRNHSYPSKFPHLKEALEDIISNSKLITQKSKPKRKTSKP